MTTPPSNPRRRSYKTVDPVVTPSRVVSSASSSQEVDGLSSSSVYNKMTLRKSATFHAANTPSSESSSSICPVPSLRRRSRTSLNDDVVAGRKDRIAKLICSFDRSLSGIGSLPLEALSSTEELPLPRVCLQAMVSEMSAEDRDQASSATAAESDRRRLRPRRGGQVHKHHASDSGIGSSESGSAYSASEKHPIVNRRGLRHGTPALLRSTTSSTHDSAIGLGNDPKSKGQPLRLVTSRSTNHHILSNQAAEAIEKYIIVPLLETRTLKDFHPLVTGIQKRIEREEISCVRDVEKTLIFGASGLAKPPVSFRTFCETSVRCVQATVEHILDERDQRLPSDRPYNDGYFVDLCEQIRQYAQMMAESRQKQAEGKQLDIMDYSPTEKLTLEGGLGTTGRPVRLVRKKGDMTIPIGATSPEDATAEMTLKRSLSSPSLEDGDAERSMARRRKSTEDGVPTCSQCSKSFKRPCDLTKHEKTHSRPWKCSESTCKYHELGWPTEKERDRHFNDKHADTPAVYECQFKPCTYKSKRESNCKQHMEKAHNWVYKRTKVGKNGIKAPELSPQAHQAPTPSTDMTVPTPNTPQLPLSPYEQAANQGLFPELYSPDIVGNASVPAFDMSAANLGGYQNLDTILDQPGPSNFSNLQSPVTGYGMPNLYTADPHSYASLPEFFDDTAMFADKDLVPDACGWNFAQAQGMQNAQLPTPLMSKIDDGTGVLQEAAGPQAYQLSPNGLDAMLYTPISEPMQSMDEGVDDGMTAMDGPGGDFQLFANNGPAAFAGGMDLFEDEFGLQGNGPLEEFAAPQHELYDDFM